MSECNSFRIWRHLWYDTWLDLLSSGISPKTGLHICTSLRIVLHYSSVSLRTTKKKVVTRLFAIALREESDRINRMIAWIIVIVDNATQAVLLNQYMRALHFRDL